MGWCIWCSQALCVVTSWSSLGRLYKQNNFVTCPSCEGGIEKYNIYSCVTVWHCMLCHSKKVNANFIVTHSWPIKVYSGHSLATYSHWLLWRKEYANENYEHCLFLKFIIEFIYLFKFVCWSQIASHWIKNIALFCRSEVFNVWSPDQKQRHHLGTYWKGKFSSPSPFLSSQKL